ncbi:MAG: helix-turn-helix transcriptional regulator [Proteobacteria bacterium]|nr:helix-turn-helix transcriptional regulator [Pseudomonadota bacterium]
MFNLPSHVFPSSVPPVHKAFDRFSERSVLGGAGRTSDVSLRDAPASAADPAELIVRSSFSKSAFRAYIAEAKGRGYWDFFRVSDNLVISVAEVYYHEDQRFDIPGEDILKIRVLLQGKLLDVSKKVAFEGPSGVICLHSKDRGSSYYVAGGIETKLVILHCGANLLQELFGIRHVNAPEPFQSMANSNREQTLDLLEIDHSLFRAATDVVASRSNVLERLRGVYISAKAVELISLIVQGLYFKRDRDKKTSSLNVADIDRIYEARAILLENFVNPPNIKRLAKLVGVNQTKLKSGFKAIVGETISDFGRRHRMETAAKLLLSSTCDVSKAAYEVGYTYTANFTIAFKRHFGYTPSELKAQSRTRGVLRRDL